MLEGLPPCLSSIISDKNLLVKYYYLVARYFHSQGDSRKFSEFLEILLRNGISIDASLDLYKPFTCSDVPQELCNLELCELGRDPITRVMARTQEVKHVKTLTGDDYLLIKIDNEYIRIPIDTEKECASFVNQMAKVFHEVIDLDKRRKKDRVLWTSLKQFWLSRAEVVNEIDVLDEWCEDDTNLQIYEHALYRLWSVELTNDKDLACTSPNFAYFDGDYAYYLRDHLLTYINSELKIRVSSSKLSRILKAKNTADSVRLRIKNVRFTFYRFKPCKDQIEAYNKLSEVREGEDGSNIWSARNGEDDDTSE